MTRERRLRSLDNSAPSAPRQTASTRERRGALRPASRGCGGWATCSDGRDGRERFVDGVERLRKRPGVIDDEVVVTLQRLELGFRLLVDGEVGVARVAGARGCARGPSPPRRSPGRGGTPRRRRRRRPPRARGALSAGTCRRARGVYRPSWCRQRGRTVRRRRPSSPSRCTRPRELLPYHVRPEQPPVEPLGDPFGQGQFVGAGMAADENQHSLGEPRAIYQ